MNIFNIMLSSQKGGLEQMAVIYAKALIGLGHKLTCIITADCPYITELKNTGAEICYMPKRNVYNFFNAFQIIKKANLKHTDIVICHGNRALGFVLNRLVRLILHPSFKTVGVMHSQHCPYKKRCDYLIFLTRTSLQCQPRKIQNKSFVLPNTVMEQPHPATPLHKPLVFGTLGRLHPVKGYDVLLNALSILKQKKYPFHCILAGTGPEEKRLIAQTQKLGLEKEISFPGWINDKKEFFDKIDVFVLSSRYDSMPLSVLEAMAFSKAIISTDCIGPKEILSKLCNSLLVQAENPDELAKALEYLLHYKKQIQIMATAGNKLFTQEYSFPAFQKKLGKILQKVKP